MNIEQMNSYLVADDDDIFRMRLARALRERGSSVIEAANSNQALDAVRSSEMSLVQRAILDLRMPGMSGLSLVSELLTLRPRLQIVMLTGYGSIATAVQAINLGCVNYPVSYTHLRAHET